ncbi:MAG: Fic family protein [Deltaproteobacteria bacterium]|nr:Fic family protein [Deltaproteobacteria bacterium]
MATYSDQKSLTCRAAGALPPVLFPGANSTERRRFAGLKAEGRIRLVGPRLYVSVPEAETAATLQKTWSTIVARLFPSALITHRTALDFRPSPAGEVFINASSNREVKYPGLVLKFIRGPGPLRDDPHFLTIRSSSLPRALLENLSTGRSSRSRVLPIEELEARLEKILHIGGEAEINRVRDRAREIAEELGWKAAFKRLDGLIGTLLGTRRGKVASASAKARAAGEPFDASCLERMQLLFADLRTPMPGIVDSFTAVDHVKNKAFFEAYFSNYIEGTTFDVSEAEEIIFDKRIPANRPKDAHDIAGTFEIVSDQGEMRRTPNDLGDLIQLTCARHATLMEHRPEAGPGRFKTEPNRAGDTHFVHPDYVRGTLRKGWELYQGLEAGLPRAILIAFLVSDVHPFIDGNGRIARIMMNAELVSAGQSTIIIPTVFRDDHVLALRALTRRNRPGPLVLSTIRAQRFSHLEFSPYPSILKDLTRRNWFREPDEARIVEGPLPG